MPENDGEVEEEEETPKKNGEKAEVRMVWKMHPRDLEDAKKVAEIIATEKKLKKKSPQYVSKYLFMTCLQQCRKEGLI